MSTSKKRRMEVATCLRCGNTFLAAVTEVKRGNGKFCSRHCQRSFQARNNARSAKKDTSLYERKKIWLLKVGDNVIKAHRAVELALSHGTLLRSTCEVCGSKKTDGHHDDYSKPLKVRWLCRYHHLQYHRHFL